MSEQLHRRLWLQRAGLLTSAVVLGGASLRAQEPSLGGRGDVGTLADPDAAGRPSERVNPMNNDAAIRELELSLKCPCPCGLDIYTCRTTDFTCTYSPESHKQILAYVAEGKTAAEIRAAFVAQYGERALMAPVAKGFNLAGYLVPGLAVLTAGGLLTWVLLRRNRLAAAAGAPTSGAAPFGDLPRGVQATPEELAALQRAMADDDR